MLVLIIAGCASVSTEKSAELTLGQAVQNEAYPKFSGERKRVQILRISIPKEIADQYPELGQKMVGWGLYNTLIDELSVSGRFQFIEEKAGVRDRILQNWALSQSGAVAEEMQIDEKRGLSLPQYLAYAEITEFSVSTKEKIVGVSMEKENTTVISVQIRLVDVATGEFVPVSGSGGASTVAKTVWLSPDGEFDGSTVALATKRAMHSAVLGWVKRKEGR